MQNNEVAMPEGATQMTTEVELTLCDKEPIHIPGSIQPHGALLVADPATLRVIGEAGLRAWGKPVVGQRLLDLFTPFEDIQFADLQRGLNILGDVTIGAKSYDVVAFEVSNRIVVELTPQIAGPRLNARFLAAIEAFGNDIDRSISDTDLFQKAARIFQQITRYDRVMIYKFVDQDAGTVVGESLAPGMKSFMNHHFPATDIPRQARALYVRNRVRVIADAGYVPSVIKGDGDFSKLDLSDSTLRSVSPTHLRYLANMGVAASASASIVKDGVLWGLVACHNLEPKDLSLTSRLACQTLATSLARQVKAREETELYRERIRLRAQEDIVLGQIGSDRSLHDFFSSAGKHIAHLLQADGFAAIQSDDLYTIGHCPDAIDIRALAEYVRLPAATRPYVTSTLAAQYPAAASFKDLASGLLAVTMSTEIPIILMWFRAEVRQTVVWAGDPHKDVPHDPQTILNPRTSFEDWKQSVEGRSIDWTLGEEESASRIVRLMLESRNARHMREINRDLNITLRENAALMQQKDYLLREVNHRVQNSLSLVAAFLRMQAREASSDVKAQLAEAENRLKAVSLVHQRLHQHENGEVLDLARYLGDLCTEMSGTLGEDWARHINTSFTPILISTDKAISIGLVVNELVLNATKYAYRGAVGPVSLSLAQHRDSFRLVVEDQGVGRDGSTKGTGFGLRMLTSLVDRLDGHLDFEDGQPGTRAIVTAKIK
ncbi:histidine kinase dimerization/phosphoacceptor domain -containing protein [Cereibacter sp. SYSU M97828]|nr:histidine kinase dimerization/phosphoacceptor domain -containing protein [Cereibacter flavus]